MFKKLFGKSKTSKFDVFTAATAVVWAVWKLADTIRQYNYDNEQEGYKK